MIIIPAVGATLRTATYLHHKSQVTAIKSLLQDSSLDCCWCSCDTEIPAFAYLDDEDDLLRNDYYSWLLQVSNDATVTATLTNVNTGTEYVITDNTYGDLYGIGELKSNIWGFIIKWYNVADLIGFGTYQLNITVTNTLSEEILNKDYPKFKLLPYSCEAAHNTVRIETLNSGYIEGGFDYRNIIISPPYPSILRGINGWLQQIRWYGRFEVSGIPTQIDNIYDNYRNLKQVQTQIENEYNLRLDFIKTDISNKIIYDNLLADYIIVSDYNANNVDDYKNVKCSLLNVENPQPFINRTQNFNIKLVPYKQNNLKRFY